MRADMMTVAEGLVVMGEVSAYLCRLRAEAVTLAPAARVERVAQLDGLLDRLCACAEAAAEFCLARGTHDEAETAELYCYLTLPAAVAENAFIRLAHFEREAAVW